MKEVQHIKKDKELASRRFFQTAEEMTIIFVPQCATCKKNIDYIKCQAFEVKPRIYMENLKDCPEFLKR